MANWHMMTLYIIKHWFLSAAFLHKAGHMPLSAVCDEWWLAKESVHDKPNYFWSFSDKNHSLLLHHLPQLYSYFTIAPVFQTCHSLMIYKIVHELWWSEYSFLPINKIKLILHQQSHLGHMFIYTTLIDEILIHIKMQIESLCAFEFLILICLT